MRESDEVLGEKALRPLAAAARSNPPALLLVAEQARARGQTAFAAELARDAAAQAPDDPEIAARAKDIVARCIPNWHASIVGDEPRNAAFQAAIERAVTPTSRVLDIGSGTGLLAMMAARAGAQAVFSCEMNAQVAEAAAGIVAANGFADRISIVASHSTDIDPEADLGGPVDILVSEIVSNDLIGEHVLPTMRNGVGRLTRPGARLIPQSGDIRVALAWWDGCDQRRMGSVCGFDLGAFNRLLPLRYALSVADRSLELRGEPASLFHFDFAAAGDASDEARLELVAGGGRVNGVVQWLRLQMDETGRYENQPGPDGYSSWGCHFFPFDAALETRPGDRVAIAATVRGDRLILWRDPA